MDYLAAAIPAIKKLKIPLRRDQVMMLIVSFNELMLAVEIYLAHRISGTIILQEWIPIIFGPCAALLLGLAGLISQRKRSLAMVITIPVLLSSIAVGALGAYFHATRAVLPYAPPGEQMGISLIIWAPPILAPLTFVLVGLLGLSAIWDEKPVDSGTLTLFGGIRLQMPFSKTRGFFFLVSLAMLATLISSVLDHARTNFSNPWLWVPTAAGILGTIVALNLGLIDEPSRGDVLVYLGSMLFIALVGAVGIALHIADNLAVSNLIVDERFIRGAPLLAPLLFSDIASIGVIILMEPGGENHRGETEKVSEYVRTGTG